MSANTTQAQYRPRIVLYSHDTLGFGHFRRNLLLADALRHSSMAPRILMIAGMREAGAFEFPEGVDVLTLPAYAKRSDGCYEPRNVGGDLDSLVELRAETIRAAVLAFDPDLMVVDNVPRGALGELSPLLETLHASRKTRLVLGLRDVIDAPSVVLQQWRERRNFEAVRHYFDDVWVYGDPHFYDLLADCGLAGPMAGKGRFTGYLDHRPRLSSPLAERERDAILGSDPRPYILCAVGGGRDGAALCTTFANTPMPAGHRGIIVTGSQMPRQLREQLRMRAQARDDLQLIDFAREPIALMAGAARIVAMGGYNTICEVLTLGRPALIVPRVEPRAEQLLRAERLAARGLVSVRHPDGLGPATLQDWLAHAAPACRAHARELDMGGRERVCAFAADLMSEPHALLTAS